MSMVAKTGRLILTSLRNIELRVRGTAYGVPGTRYRISLPNAHYHFLAPFNALESFNNDESGRAAPRRPVPLRPSGPLPDAGDESPRLPAMRTFTPRPIAPTLPTITRSPTSRPDVTCTMPDASSTTPNCTGWCSIVSFEMR